MSSACFRIDAEGERVMQEILCGVAKYLVHIVSLKLCYPRLPQFQMVGRVRSK